jgi:circadian locomoter output cycles kaput protein
MFTQYSMPQTQTSQTITFQQQNSQPLQPSPHTMLSSNSSICHQSTTSEHSQSTPMSTPFMDQSYIAAIPVQPMFAGTVIAPVIPPPADYVHSNVVLSPAQNHFQDHLQRRHEELQKIIMQQQDELRRVSEQLLFTKYGIIPVNVQVPFVTTIDSTEQNQELSSESSPCMSSSSHMMHSNYYEQNPPQNVQMVVPPYQQQQMMSGHHHDPIMSQHTTQLQQNYGELKPIESSDGSDYLQSSNQQQQQSQQQQQQHQQQQQQQQQQQSNDYEMMSYQMMTGQWESNTSQQSQQQNQQENATDSMNN